MNTTQTLLAKLRVILTAAVTWLVVLGTIVASVMQIVAQHAPEGWENALKILGVIAGIVVSATTIIRRVTEVLPEERGILPVEPPAE